MSAPVETRRSTRARPVTDPPDRQGKPTWFFLTIELWTISRRGSAGRVFTISLTGGTHWECTRSYLVPDQLAGSRRSFDPGGPGLLSRLTKRSRRLVSVLVVA